MTILTGPAVNLYSMFLPYRRVDKHRSERLYTLTAQYWCGYACRICRALSSNAFTDTKLPLPIPGHHWAVSSSSFLSSINSGQKGNTRHCVGLARCTEQPSDFRNGHFPRRLRRRLVYFVEKRYFS